MRTALILGGFAVAAFAVFRLARSNAGTAGPTLTSGAAGAPPPVLPVAPHTVVVDPNPATGRSGYTFTTNADGSTKFTPTLTVNQLAANDPNSAAIIHGATPRSPFQGPVLYAGEGPGT